VQAIPNARQLGNLDGRSIGPKDATRVAYPTMGTVLLFDLDGTLLNTGGAGRRAMIGACVALHGRDDTFVNFSFAGMTDKAIARHALTHATAASDDAAIDHFLDTYVRLLEEELPKSERYEILPGVLALLERLANRPNVAVGLGTGNIKRGAYAKLSRGQLHGAFAFGGFGCDAENRVELLRAGATRGADQLGKSLADCRVVVIGDTPKDIAAAKGLGAPCLAVATGGFTVEDLGKHDAAHVVATLEDAKVLDILLSP